MVVRNGLTATPAPSPLTNVPYGITTTTLQSRSRRNRQHQPPLFYPAVPGPLLSPYPSPKPALRLYLKVISHVGVLFWSLITDLFGRLSIPRIEMNLCMRNVAASLERENRREVVCVIYHNLSWRQENSSR